MQYRLASFPVQFCVLLLSTASSWRVGSQNTENFTGSFFRDHYQVLMFIPPPPKAELYVERDRDRGLPSASHSPNGLKSQDWTGQNQEPRTPSRSPTWAGDRGLRAWAPSGCLPGALAGKVEQPGLHRHSDTGCQPLGQQLDALRPDAGPGLPAFASGSLEQSLSW